MSRSELAKPHFRKVGSLVLVLVLLSALPLLIAGVKAEKQDSDPLNLDEIRAASLINLIANPLDYRGSRVSVTGFAYSDSESASLYLSEREADFLNFENSVSLGVPEFPNGINNCYVMVVGKFVEGRNWTFERPSWMIVEIERFEPLVTYRKAGVRNDCSKSIREQDAR